MSLDEKVEIIIENGEVKSEKQKRKSYGSYFTGILLIGMGLLLFIPGLQLFPYIFLVLALCFVPNLFIKDKFKNNLQYVLWFVGIFIVFYFNIIVAGMLILVGIQILVSGILK